MLRKGSSSPKLRTRRETMMKRFESQKMRDSEPRRTLIRSSYPDVQWRRLSKEDRLRERGFHHKVSMKKEKENLEGNREIYTRRIQPADLPHSVRRLYWTHGLSHFRGCFRGCFSGRALQLWRKRPAVPQQLSPSKASSNPTVELA